MKNYYKNRENCFSELYMARKVMGSKNTTEAQFNAMEQALGFMYLYADEDVAEHAYNILNEAEIRRVFFEPIWAQTTN